MKLGKAIEILTIHSTDGGSVVWASLQEAEKLGIEALKEIERARVVGLFPDNHQLPGETKE